MAVTFPAFSTYLGLRAALTFSLVRTQPPEHDRGRQEQRSRRRAQLVRLLAAFRGTAGEQRGVPIGLRRDEPAGGEHRRGHRRRVLRSGERVSEGPALLP